MSQTMYKLGRRVRTFFRWIDNHWYKIILTVIAIALFAIALGLFSIANELDYISISGDLDVY